MAVVKNLMVRAGADFSGMKREMEKASKNLSDFKNSMNSTLKGIGGALAALGIGAVIKDAVRSAMDVEASMQQINRTMGTSAQTFTDWANKSAIAFNMGKSDAIKYGAVYSNLISGFAKDTATTTKYTEDLLKASAVVASSTGRSMSDVMERIRSGMLGNTESIEDLGINVNVAMIESTKSFQKFANGKSWDQLSFQVQQQIRLFAILEQSTTKYGDTVANNTNSKQQQFVAQLKNTQLSLGQAFLPIYNAVLPALTSMASALSSVMSVVAQFSQALFGKTDTQKQTDATKQQAGAVGALGDAYTAAGQAAQGAVAGFDEVNTLSSGAGAAKNNTPSVAAGMNVPGTSEATDTISSKVQEMANKVKAAFKAMKDAVVNNKELIIAALIGLAAGFATYLIAMNWGAIVGGISAAFVALRGSIAAAWAAITGPIALIALGIAALVAAFVYFYQTNEAFRGVVDGILQKIGDVIKWLWTEVLVPFGVFLAGTFVVAWKALVEVATWLWVNVLVPIGIFLSGVFVEAWNGLKTVVAKAKEAFSLLGDKLVEIKDGAIKWVTEKVTALTQAFKDHEAGIRATAITLGVIFGPALITTGIQAVATGLQITTSFIASLIASGAAAVTNAALVTANFISSMIQASAQAVLTGVAITVSFIGAMVKSGIEAAATALIITGQMIVALSSYAVQGWITVASITAQTVAWTANKVVLLSGAIAMIAMTVATTAQSVASGILTAAQWALNVALDANPIGLVIIAIAALGAAVYAIIKYWDNITAAIKTAWEWLTKWNGSKAEDKKVTITEETKTDAPPGGKYIPQSFTLPKLARGGIVDGATNMGNYISGEAGAEMIVPLENTSFVDKLASALGTAVMSAMQFNGSNNNNRQSDVVINLDGIQLARVLSPYTQKENSRIGAPMISSAGSAVIQTT